MNTMMNKRVRCYDFPPMFGRTDRYIEGVVTADENGMITVGVLKDTMMPEGHRTEIRCPRQGFCMFDHNHKRVQVIEDDVSEERTEPHITF